MFLLTTYMQNDSQDDVHPSCINHPASRYTFIFPFHSSPPKFCDSNLFLWTFISIQDKPSFVTPASTRWLQPLITHRTHRSTKLSTTNEEMEGHTDPRPSGSSQHSEQGSPESQGHSRDSRRGGRPSWRERHPSGPYQRPPRAGSAQSGLATSWAATQDDEAVIATASNSDAAAGAPNLLASAMTDLRLDGVPSALNTNVPHQHPSDDSDHSDLNQGQGTQPWRYGTSQPM